MKISGIVSEYNPFHNGHKYHIKKTRENGATHIVAVMSGNFVQRGECAVFEKRSRAACALANGVDLVLELPVAFACAAAQTFARGAVFILDSLGCVDELSFGSECADIHALAEVSENIGTDTIQEALRIGLDAGMTFAAAREAAVRYVLGEKADILKSPNDTLAVEYICAIKKLNSSIEPFAVKREGAKHDSKSQESCFCSASLIREQILSGKIDSALMPSTEILMDEIINGRAPVDFYKLEKAILFRLRTMSAQEIAQAPDISEGIENRIFNAVRSSSSLEELYAMSKTKRYSHARIRRIVLHSFLGIKALDNSGNPPYIRVLGMNQRGTEILREARSKASLPIIMRAGDAEKLDYRARRTFELECRAADIFTLAMPKPLPCATEQTGNVIIL